MEPRLLRHGNNVGGSTTVLTDNNVLQWSHVFSDMEIRLASMLASMLVKVLQWSHVFSDMEIRHVHLVVDFVVMLQWSHVFSDMEISASRQ